MGEPLYFEGDINLITDGSGYDLIDKPFGFFEVEVFAPDSMKLPLLKTRLKQLMELELLLH